METLKNKVYAIILMVLGFIPVIIEQDATALIFLSVFAIPLFFARRNWIN